METTHPIWSIIRVVVFVTALVIILLMTSSNFDETEMKTVAIVACVGVLMECLINYFQNLMRGIL